MKQQQKNPSMKECQLRLLQYENKNGGRKKYSKLLNLKKIEIGY